MNLYRVTVTQVCDLMIEASSAREAKKRAREYTEFLPRVIHGSQMEARKWRAPKISDPVRDGEREGGK